MGSSAAAPAAHAARAALPAASFVAAAASATTAGAAAAPVTRQTPEASDGLVVSEADGLLSTFASTSISAATSTPASASLSLADAEAMTLRLLPQLAVAQASLGAAQAAVIQARAAWLPQLSANGSYSRQTANFVLRPGALPRGLSGTSLTTTRSQSYDYFNFGLTLSQLIYDFGAVYHQLRAARLAATVQTHNLDDQVQQALLATRLAYFAAANKQAQWRLSGQTVANQVQHRLLVTRQVRAGQRPVIDLAAAETDVANACVAEINARNAWDGARADLRQALGVQGLAGDYVLADDTLPPLAEEDAALDLLVRLALLRRPDLAMQRTDVARADALHKASRAAWLPTLTASAGLTEAGQKIDDMGWNWNVGAQLAWRLFDGGSTLGARRAAAAEVLRAQAQRAVVRQTLLREVEVAQLAVHAARALQGATTRAEVQAQAQLRLAEGRYAGGLGQIVELGDAQLAARAAAAASIEARYGLAQARAQLARALGQ